jgi:hypothetical protein
MPTLGLPNPWVNAMHTHAIPISRLTAAVVAATLAAGCEASKSSNPLSPAIAGPIAGVSIEAPVPVSPANGSEVLNTDPVRLVFNNATTNGVRPLYYLVELGSDANFSNMLYSSGKVTPGEGGRTSVVVDGTLAAERTYFWRAKAADGANESTYSTAARFDLVVPVIIEAPTPVSPAGGQTTANNTPSLVVNNGRVQGRAGDVRYRYYVARDQHFGNVVAEIDTARSSGGQTTVQAAPLPAGTLLFWRVVATNGNIRDTSITQSFRTPGGGGGGGGGGGPAPGPLPPPPPGNAGRRPDPPAGQLLPVPDVSHVVFALAQQYPHLLANSCQEHGGTWQFLDVVVDYLRATDDQRWGYNCKRGNCGDPSQDVIAYHAAAGPTVTGAYVRTVDVIAGHCGGSPSPTWLVHDAGPVGSNGWTSRGRF